MSDEFKRNKGLLKDSFSSMEFDDIPKFVNEIVKSSSRNNGKRRKCASAISPWNRSTDRLASTNTRVDPWSTVNTVACRAAMMIHTHLTGSCTGAVYHCGNAFVAEEVLSNGKTLVLYHAESGMLKGVYLTASGSIVGSVRTEDMTDSTCLTMLLLTEIVMKNDDFADVCNGVSSALLKLADIKSSYADNDPEKEDMLDAIAYLGDIIYYGTHDKGNAVPKLKIAMDMGALTIVDSADLSVIRSDASLIWGTSTILAASGQEKAKKQWLFKDAYNLQDIKKWRENHDAWTEDERNLIPTFPDTYLVPKDVLFMAKMFIRTHDSNVPAVNFFWRGTSGVGKSTGVEILAALLGKPLLRMTCSTDTETTDFKCSFVPDTNMDTAPIDLKSLPSIEEMMYTPDEAWEKLTGESNPTSTTADCEILYQQKLLQAGSKNCTASGQVRYKLVLSDYLTALINGYVIEVQEISRIRNSGVLVGTNEYAKPGASIPLLDGTHARRHRDALLVYTDNVGLESCNPIDASALRRTAFVIQSDKLEKNDVLERVKINTGFSDEALLVKMYDTWKKVDDYCRAQFITDGSVTIEELENWVRAFNVMNNDDIFAESGNGTLKKTFRVCVANKATEDETAQTALMAFVQEMSI